MKSTVAASNSQDPELVAGYFQGFLTMLNIMRIYFGLLGQTRAQDLRLRWIYLLLLGFLGKGKDRNIIEEKLMLVSF